MDAAEGPALLESLPTAAEAEGWDRWPGTLLQYGSLSGNYTVLYETESGMWTDVVMPTCVKDAKTINDQNTNFHIEFYNES